MKRISTRIRFVLFVLAIFPVGYQGFTKNINSDPLMNAGALLTAEFEGTHWEKTYGGPEREIGCSIQVTGDGGYIIGGLTNSFGAGDRDVYLIKKYYVENKRSLK